MAATITIKRLLMGIILLLTTMIVVEIATAVNAKPASAATNTISGTASEYAYGDYKRRLSNASVYLQYYNGSRWVDLGKKATTSSTGTYRITGVTTGYYYRVQAYKVYQYCMTLRYWDPYMGYSPPVYLGSRAVTANVKAHWLGSKSC